ncbi:LysR family transcriptional regulator [Salinicola endophyticus]|uniref:LysR family transcriptional regulator n=1 Tax=Salinicola endophyticus TaxID=1949083 RepID=A0ABY8FBW8_9GAMM|nr:LysR substrate-binding domain-containing protein [Salinicola endophyticus]WFF40308.1 LysR family transcriptional regulator [Salinicola endophyticus]
MELRTLRYFVAVAEELHFSRAAARLGISQPPLSQQIKALEEELGGRLLVRTNRRVALTAAGTLFLDEAREVLARAERASRLVSRLGRGESGQLRIGFTTSVPLTSLLPRTLMHYRQRYPDVDLRMHELNSQRQITPLLEGDLDIGIMRRATLPPELSAFTLIREPLVAVVNAQSELGASDTPLSLAELATQPFVYFSPAAGTGLLDQFNVLFAQRGLTPRLVQEVGGPNTIISLVASGLGVSLLPESFRHIHIDNVRYRPISDADARSEVWLTHARHPLTPQAQHFIQLVREAIAD